MANLFLLIVLCVIAIFAAQNHRTSNFRVAELSVRAFPTGGKIKARTLKLRNQLANFARHMLEFIIQSVTLLLLNTGVRQGGTKPPSHT